MPDDRFGNWLIVTVATVLGAMCIGGAIGECFGDGYVIPCAIVGGSAFLLQRIFWN